MQELFGNLWNLQWQQVVMWGIGGLLIWLAIKKEMEPSLLLPMGFGAILVNLPLSGAVTQVLSTGTEVGPLDVLFDAGIANELFPLLLFVGIPLPGTGAWTGTLAASLLDMDFKESVLACMGGVLLAGCIMGVLSTLGISAFGAIAG